MALQIDIIGNSRERKIVRILATGAEADAVAVSPDDFDGIGEDGRFGIAGIKFALGGTATLSWTNTVNEPAAVLANAGEINGVSFLPPSGGASTGVLRCSTSAAGMIILELRAISGVDYNG